MQVLALRDQVLRARRLSSLVTTILRMPRVDAAELDDAVDLGDDRRVLRLARLEQLGHARQTAGDVARLRRLRARILTSAVAGGDLLAVAAPARRAPVGSG